MTRRSDGAVQVERNAMNRLLASALAFCFAIPIAGAAVAHTDTATQVQVRYGDLDLSSASGAAVMLQRIDDAATEACGAPWGSLREYRLSVQRSACHRESMERAVAAVESPALSALLQQRPVHGFETN
jgi:UrcA family protein